MFKRVGRVAAAVAAAAVVVMVGVGRGGGRQTRTSPLWLSKQSSSVGACRTPSNAVNGRRSGV
jgi:hypothetical protein